MRLLLGEQAAAHARLSASDVCHAQPTAAARGKQDHPSLNAVPSRFQVGVQGLGFVLMVCERVQGLGFVLRVCEKVGAGEGGCEIIGGSGGGRGAAGGRYA